MKESDLYKAFGSTPESVTSCITYALHHSNKEERMKKKISAGLVIVLAFVLVTGVVYAVANPSWLAEFFGKLYSQKVVEELNEQTPSILNKTYELGDLTITLLEAAIIPDGSLFVTANVTLKVGAPGVLMHDGSVPSDPAYVNPYDMGLRDPNLNMEEVPTYAELAKERGEKLLLSHVWIEVGYWETGYSYIEKEDESYTLVVENIKVTPEGGTVPLKVGALMFEMTPEGHEVEGTRIRQDWTLDIPVTIASKGN